MQDPEGVWVTDSDLWETGLLVALLGCLWLVVWRRMSIRSAQRTQLGSGPPPGDEGQGIGEIARAAEPSPTASEQQTPPSGTQASEGDQMGQGGQQMPGSSMPDGHQEAVVSHARLLENVGTVPRNHIYFDRQSVHPKRKAQQLGSGPLRRPLGLVEEQAILHSRLSYFEDTDQSSREKQALPQCLCC